MANGYNAGSVILPGYCHVLYAPVGTTAPTDPYAVDISGGATAPFTDFTLLGYTSEKNTLKLTRSGGDQTTFGANQNSSLRSSTAPVTFSMSIPALEARNDVLSFYFGGGVTTGNNTFGVPLVAAAQTSALYVVLVDGNDRMGLNIPQASVVGDGDIEFDPGAITEFGLSAAIQGAPGQTTLMQFIKANLGVPAPVIRTVSPTTGTIAGSTVVSMTGENLSAVTAVNFGGTAGTSLTKTATTITVTTPAKTAGSYPITVVSPLGTFNVAQQFTYV